MSRHVIRLCLVLLIVLVTIALFGAQLAERYLPSVKGAIQTELSKALGADVLVGNATLEFMPLPKIVLSGVSIAAPGGRAKIAEVDRVVVRFSVLPLFKRRLVIQDLLFEGPQISLQWAEGKPAVAGAVATPSISSSPLSTAEQTPAAVASVQESWEVALKDIQIREGLLRLATAKGAHQIPLRHLRSSVRREGSRFSFGDSVIEGAIDRLPFTLSARSVGFDQENSQIEIQDGKLTLADEQLNLSGSWGAAGGRAVLSCSNLAFGKIRSRLPPELPLQGFPVTDGLITTRLTASGSSSSSIRVEGSLQADKLKFNAPKFSLTNLKLEKLLVDIASGDLRNLRADIALQNLNMSEGQDSYAAKSVSGSVSYAVLPTQERTCNGAIAVTEFQYQDAQVKVSEVIASFSDIEARINRAGGITLKGLLSASKVKVSDPSVTVDQVAKVVAPLQISIPAKGGYEVKGPVTVSGGAVTVHSRPIIGIDGTISMLVSGPLKRFQSPDLKALVAGKTLLSKVDFSMTPIKYELQPATFRLGEGEIKGSFTLSRDKRRALRAQVHLNNFALADAVALAGLEGTKKLEGTITRFQCSASARMGDLAETLSGKGSLQLTQGGQRAEEFAEKLLRAVAAIPLVGVSLQSKEEKARGAREQIKSDFTIHDQSVRFDNLVAGLPSYTVKARGTVSFSGDVAAKADVIFLRESFAEFGFGFDQLGKLLGRAGKIEIPLQLSGDISSLIVEPDLVQLAKNNSGLPLLKSAFKAGRDFGGKVVDGMFGNIGASKGKSSSSSSSSSSLN